jgi:hypothetical protein
MLIIESTSLVKRFRTKKEEAFNMVIPPEMTLGTGSFGIVYGPFSAEKMRDILFQIYRPVPGAVPGCRCDWATGICAACLESMRVATNIRFRKGQRKPPQQTQKSGIDVERLIPDGVSYIFKADFRSVRLEDCKRREEIVRGVKQMPLLYQRHFILPLVCGATSFARFEIQRYGGTDFFEELTSGKPWASLGAFVPVLDSVSRIIEGCFWLIEKSRILITDIKPENMTYHHETGELFLIDIEYAFLDRANKHPVVYTMNEAYIPVQFYNHVFFPAQADRDQRRQRYLSEAKRQTYYVLTKNPGPEDMAPISRFCITWVMTHILLYVAQYKFPKDKDIAKQINKWAVSLRRLRWDSGGVPPMVENIKSLKQSIVRPRVA